MIRPYLALLLICFGGHNSFANGDSPKADASINGIKSNQVGQNICGPRSVKTVLDYYGCPKNYSLHSLVKKIQWEHVNRGTSLLEISKTLEEHGIKNEPFSISRYSAINWKYPAIVHLQSDNIDSPGHYVVWLPNSNRKVCYFSDGLAGVRSLPTWEFTSLIKGGILVTWPEQETQLSTNNVAILNYDSIVLVIGFVTATLLLLVVLAIVTSVKTPEKSSK